MNRSLTAPTLRSGRSTTQAEATEILGVTLRNPHVTAQQLADAIKKFTPLVRHCRPQVYDTSTEPMHSEFMLAFAAAKMAAFACDNLEPYITLCRDRAKREGLGYSLALELEYALWGSDALNAIITYRSFRTHTHHASYAIAHYTDAYRRESDRAQGLKSTLDADHEPEESARPATTTPLALAS